VHLTGAVVLALPLSFDLPGRSCPRRVTLCLVLDADDTIARSKEGDQGAFRELFLRHRGEVARLVYRMAGTDADVEDLVQEVFFQVHRSLKDFRGQSKFTTWLHRVTVNVVLMQRRAARSRPQLVATQSEDVLPDPRMLPDEDAARRERQRAFARLVDGLADKKRVVFILHELEGMAPSEIAAIVGAPVLTVRTRLFYARRELSDRMRQEPVLASFADGLRRPGGAERFAPSPSSLARTAKAIGGSR
jgi:RNA polymerase sigma-70 factor, ECF subfamily